VQVYPPGQDAFEEHGDGDDSAVDPSGQSSENVSRLVVGWSEARYLLGGTKQHVSLVHE
jgi:hypothetical protein